MLQSMTDGLNKFLNHEVFVSALSYIGQEWLGDNTEYLNNICFNYNSMESLRVYNYDILHGIYGNRKGAV